LVDGGAAGGVVFVWFFVIDDAWKLKERLFGNYWISLKKWALNSPDPWKRLGIEF